MARIGTSGWVYPHWQGVLYHEADQRRWLGTYMAEFDTVELNASFYRWPPPARFASWRSRLPEGFEMTVKAPRGLTHARRLYEPEQWIERVTAGLHELRGRRGPLIVQLPPTMAARRCATGLVPRRAAGLDAPGRRVPASVLDG